MTDTLQFVGGGGEGFFHTVTTVRQLFGVRRLDAALVSGGLTPLDVGQSYFRVEANKVILILISGQESGVKPPRTKAASSRRTPNS